MSHKSIFYKIRESISKNEIDAALNQLSNLLNHSPNLDEVIHQSGRFEAIRKQIRLGTVTHSDAVLTENQIKSSILDLLRKIEDDIMPNSENPLKDLIRSELEKNISIVSSSNVIIDSTLRAGRDININDNTIITESSTSRNLRLWLYVLIPVLVFSTVYFWIKHDKNKTPISLTVRLKNLTPNAALPFKGGKLSLQLGDKTETQPVKTEAYFKGIPAVFWGKTILLSFEGDGFFPIDTNFKLCSDYLNLQIRRDSSFGVFSGYIEDEDGKLLSGAKILIGKFNTVSDSDGKFYLYVPLDKQLKEQLIKVNYKGLKYNQYTTPSNNITITLL